MKRIGEFDCGLITKDMDEFFSGIGYKHIFVYAVKASGTVDVIISGGRWRPPTKEQIAKFNDMKLNGACYTVSRVKWLRPFKRPFTLWSNKNWDTD